MLLHSIEVLGTEGIAEGLWANSGAVVLLGACDATKHRSILLGADALHVPQPVFSLSVHDEQGPIDFGMSRPHLFVELPRAILLDVRRNRHGANRAAS